MEPVTRRKFLVAGSAGVAGAATLGVGGAAALTGSKDSEPELRADELEVLGRPVLMHIRDAATGEVELLVDHREVVFTDKALVAKVLRAAS
jgi:hypothetical protein